MTHGSLFSGIGGFDLAAEWMGWENVFHCEIEPFPQKILKHYWPNAELFTDIKTADFSAYADRIDVLTGGFPCQPYSTAGKRLGKEDERHLWPYMLRAIQQIRPRWVVGENVFGLVNWSGGLVFHEVQADLEAAGYEVQPYVLPACGVNAPHKRDRIWFVAKNTNGCGRIQRKPIEERSGIWQQRDAGAGDTERLCGEAVAGAAADTTGGESGESQAWHGRGGIERGGEEIGRGDGVAADTEAGGMERGWPDRKQEPQTSAGAGLFGRYHSGDGWHNFPTQPPVCGRNDGFSSQLDGITFSKWRNESIKGYGNAVVPQVVYQIFKAIEQYELLQHNA